MSAVRSLNRHVLNRSSFASLDDYLESSGVTVSREWAVLCEKAGFLISENNIS